VKFLAFVAFLGFAFVLSACPNDTRFPICKSDAECAAREENGGKLLCDNLRCVQCRYDTDCPAGSYCDKTLVCQTIAPKQTEDPTVSTEDYQTLDECMKACKDSACTDICNARFPEASKKKPKRR
jgi:Cys-rich repeat protein